jgi:hypothetical protein
MAKRGRIIVHAGIHKTGTTSLQVALSRIRPQLKERRIRYPQLEVPGGVRAHHALARGLAAERPEDDPVIADFLDRCRAFGGTMVVSSERFSILPADSVNRVVDVLRGLFDDVAAVLYFRPQVLILRSQYSQQLREGYVSCTFQEFFDRATQHARFWRFRELCEAWQIAVGEGNFHARSAMRSDLIGHDIVKDFLATFLGIGDIDAPPASRNDSLSRGQARVIRRILLDTDALAIPFETRRIRLQQFIKEFDWGPLSHDGEIPITPEMFDYCRQRFRDENAYLSRYFGGKDLFGAWYETMVQGASSRPGREGPPPEEDEETAGRACRAWADFIDAKAIGESASPG